MKQRPLFASVYHNQKQNSVLSAGLDTLVFIFSFCDLWDFGHRIPVTHGIVSQPSTFATTVLRHTRNRPRAESSFCRGGDECGGGGPGQRSGGVAQPEAGDGLTGSCDNHCVGCHWELDSPSVEGREDEVIKLLTKRTHSNYHNYRPIALLPVLN